MRGIKPNKKIWERVNAVIIDENAAVVLITFQSAMCQLLIQSGVARNEDHARAQLAAMLLSPDTGPVGSLKPMLDAELANLDDGKWIA